MVDEDGRGSRDTRIHAVIDSPDQKMLDLRRRQIAIESGKIKVLIIGMPDDFALDQINHFFGDVGGVIADTFQMA